MKLKPYLLALFIFLGIDSIWLGRIAPRLYRRQTGHLMSETPNLGAVGIFYWLFVGKLVYSVVKPALVRSLGWLHLQRMI